MTTFKLTLDRTGAVYQQFTMNRYSFSLCSSGVKRFLRVRRFPRDIEISVSKRPFTGASKLDIKRCGRKAYSKDGGITWRNVFLLRGVMETLRKLGVCRKCYFKITKGQN